MGNANNRFKQIEKELRLFSLKEAQVQKLLSLIKKTVEKSDNKKPKNWCEHIRWDGFVYYYRGDYNFFSPVQDSWKICPECKKERPE